MKLILGLGNPGKKYESTRHNIGFRVLDALARELDIKFKFEKKFNAEIAKNDDVILAKPQTFMNNSGEAAKTIKNYFNLRNAEILTIHDEIDLPLGATKLSKDSGSAGHNGVESIIRGIGQDFYRLRLGIENREQNRVPSTENYVLQNFTSEEEQKFNSDIVTAALTEIQKFITKKQAPR